ncbi:MAG: hypothetical protein HY905_02060 [Deltaproteobacteria bacterium]|nr:hypothetical protein [Deltaproteobacteria bacterium]
MSSVRLLRLRSDHDAVRRLVRLHPRVSIEGVSGNPPDRYVLVLRVRSLRQQGDAIVAADAHRLEIRLPQGYPRDAPACRMLTPVFHPNVAPHAVCVGDHWSAAETLDTLIQRVGEMLAFQSYNTRSPLNGQAARWVDEHTAELPVDREEFYVDLAESERRSSVAPLACSNCGGSPAVWTCARGHNLCGDCATTCRVCGRSLCLACGQPPCPDCGPGR